MSMIRTPRASRVITVPTAHAPPARADSPAVTVSPASAAAPARTHRPGARHACHVIPAITPMTAKTTHATPVRRAGMRRKPARANAPNVHWEPFPTRVHRAHANPVPLERSPSTFARLNASPALARSPAMRPVANAGSWSAIRDMRRTDPGCAPLADWEAIRPMDSPAFPALWAPTRTWWDRVRARRARPVALPHWLGNRPAAYAHAARPAIQRPVFALAASRTTPPASRTRIANRAIAAAGRLQDSRNASAASRHVRRPTRIVLARLAPWSAAKAIAPVSTATPTASAPSRCKRNSSLFTTRVNLSGSGDCRSLIAFCLGWFRMPSRRC